MKIETTEFFIETFQNLDSSERRVVLKSVRKLELSTDWIGKRMQGQLHNARSLRTGHGSRLRIVYVEKKGTGILLIVGERKDLRVYSRAANILRELGL